MRREEKSTQIALEEATAWYKEAKASAEFASQEVERNKELFNKGLIAESAYQKKQAESNRLQASTEAYRLAINRIKMEHNIRTSDRKLKIESLRREVAMLNGKISVVEKTIARIEQEIDNYIIRALISGRIGEMLEIKPGSVVNMGEQLVSIVPAGEVQIFAQFSKQATYFWRVSATNEKGTSNWSEVWLITTEQETAVEQWETVTSLDYYLYQNFPNPFNPLTTIQFSLPELTKVL